MRTLRYAVLAVLMVLGLAAFAAACGGDDDGDGGSGGSPATKDDVDLTQGQDVTIAMVTHGDGGSFWAVAKKGAEDGAKAMGVTLKYSESNNDPQKQAQMIDAAVTDKVDGLAVSAPDPDDQTGNCGDDGDEQGLRSHAVTVYAAGSAVPA